MAIEIKRKFVEKPWGAEDWLVQNEHYVTKHLYINPGEQISLQFHHEKHETMIVLEGMGELSLGREGFAQWEDPNNPHVFKSTITAGDIIPIPPQTIHQIRAYTGLKILEISTPQTEDLVRVGVDKYGRE
jgi:mannose-6-phosphate isomerase-like protein (cupin superfamily)